MRIKNIETDGELIRDFFDELNADYDAIVNILISLEKAPKNAELINSLFRHIHSIKSNLRMMGLVELSKVIHALETTFDDIRRHNIDYDISLSDVFLLTMDKVKSVASLYFEKSTIGLNLNPTIAAITAINFASKDMRQYYIEQAILQLDPKVEVDENSKNIQSKKRENLSLADDLEFFRGLSIHLEKRSNYWEGRTKRALSIAQQMNNAAGNPVAPIQLEAAIYIHDIGMSFLPLALIYKQGYTEEELDLIRRHPIDAYILLQRVSLTDEWHEAAEIALAHHERVDGTGYPRNLSGSQIPAGAKILSIVDAYEVLTHSQALATNLKRPLLRAIMELNNCAGTRFDSEYVEIFNQVIKAMQARGKI